MKKYNIVKVLLITILVMVLLTWIFPAAYYSSELVDQGRLQMGLSELFNYPLTAVSYFGHIAVFILLIGGFYGILYKIPAYRVFLDKVVKKFEGKEKVFLAIVTVLLSLGVSFAGLHIAYFLFIPLIISLILLMGYDKIVAAMTVVGSVAVGFIGLTYSTTINSVLLSTLALKNDYQIGVRFVLLLVGIVLLLFNIYMYIKLNGNKLIKKEVKEAKVEIDNKVVEVKKETTKTVKTTTKSSSKSKAATKSTKGKSTSKSKSKNKAALKDGDIIVVKESVVKNDDNDSYLLPSRVGSQHKVWPFTLFFTLMFVLLVLAFINWNEGGFGIKLFDDVTKSVTEFKLFKFAIFGKLFGTTNAFGTWNVMDLFVPMALVILLLSIIYKVKFDDICDGFVAGVKKAAGPSLVIILLYTVLVITTYHPFQTTLYKAFLDISKTHLNIITTMIVTLLAAIFNVDALYSFQALLPYYVSVVTKVDNYALTGIIAQSMYGFALLFAPTSFILMSVLAYLKVSYCEWLKAVWKLLLELFVTLLVVFIILALI